jgi:hypothetical protein
MITIGQKVKVIKRRNQIWGNSLVGMIGTVNKVDDSVYSNWEKRNGAERKILITADNYGPYLFNKSGGSKKIFAWVPNNISTFYEEELIVI